MNPEKPTHSDHDSFLQNLPPAGTGDGHSRLVLADFMEEQGIPLAPVVRRQGEQLLRGESTFLGHGTLAAQVPDPEDFRNSHLPPHSFGVEKNNQSVVSLYHDTEFRPDRPVRIHAIRFRDDSPRHGTPFEASFTPEEALGVADHFRERGHEEAGAAVRRWVYHHFPHTRPADSPGPHWPDPESSNHRTQENYTRDLSGVLKGGRQ